MKMAVESMEMAPGAIPCPGRVPEHTLLVQFVDQFAHLIAGGAVHSFNGGVGRRQKQWRWLPEITVHPALTSPGF